MPPQRRRTASPNAEDLAGVTSAPPPVGRLSKAPASDPVLGIASAPVPAPGATPATPVRTATSPPTRGGTATPATNNKTKVGFYQDVDDAARARAAYKWTNAEEGHRSFSDFLAHAVMREVQRLEAEYHHGEPWTAVEPGELPTGKPIGVT